MQGRPFDFAILALGVVTVSTAAVIIRGADAPALVISAYRLVIASLPLLLFATARRSLTLPGRRNQLLSVLAGVFLALHVAFWISSVQQTSVVTSVALVTSQPLFVGLASGPLLGEQPSRGIWLGLALATAGALVMVTDDLGAGGDTLRGDLFALLGAALAAAYVLSGRAVRTSGTGWSAYITVAYATAALILLAMTAVSGDAFGGYSNETYFYMALLALGPQLVGHTSINRSLGHLPAVTVAIAILGEPVGATILAALFLGETPTALEIGGGMLLLAGVYAGIRASVGTRATLSLAD